jgi:hypothetical protein
MFRFVIPEIPPVTLCVMATATAGQAGRNVAFRGLLVRCMDAAGPFEGSLWLKGSLVGVSELRRTHKFHAMATGLKLVDTRRKIVGRLFGS